MMLYPQCQQSARIQLDTFVGVDRLPEHSDLDKLPYIRQIMKETLRCKRPILVL